MLDGVTRTRLARFIPQRWRFVARRSWRQIDRLSKGAPFRSLTPLPDPILIVGNQKGGTSAVAGLLSMATGLPATVDLVGELIEPFVPRVLNGDLSLDDFMRHNDVDFTRPIIKDCHMTLLIDQLMQRLPESQVVFVVRDPRDNIRSILNRVGVDGQIDSLPAEVFERLGPGWRLVMNSRWLGSDTDDPILGLADRWNTLVDIYLRNRDEMTLVKFEEFTGDKVGRIQQLANSLGRAPTSDITSSIDIQFQPAGDRQVAMHEFFGRRRLSEIEDRCAQRMEALGYGPR